MGIYEDIETELGSSGYSTSQNHDPILNIQYVGSSVAEFSDIEGLLSLPADFEDLAVELVNGDVVSIYGDESEFTLVYLVDTGDSKWCHCFKYGTLEDYNAGKATQVPAVELRV